MKIVKILIAAVAAIVLCIVATSCLKDKATQTTYYLGSFSYSSTPKPKAGEALQKELTELCAASTGKVQEVVASEADKILDKYTTNEYTPYDYSISINYTDGKNSGFILKQESR